MTNELMKELEELRQYKKETFYRLTDEDIRVMLQDNFCDVEIEQDDVDRIMELARNKFEMEWAESIYWFVDCWFPDILEKYRSLEKLSKGGVNMKMYEEDGIDFTELSEEQVRQLTEIEPDLSYVSKNVADHIKEILNFATVNNVELQGLRNSVVKELSAFMEHQDIETIRKTMTQLSMITGCIDHEKVNRGMPV